VVVKGVRWPPGLVCGLDRGAYDVGTNPLALTAANLDGNKRTDLAVANLDDDNVYTLASKRNGTLKDPQMFDVGNAPLRLGAGALDRAGADDLAVPNTADANVSVLLNR
jgi:hypothetical protein